jgi:hypothetical protein
VAGLGLTLTEPVEGKVEIKAAIGGLLKINIAALESINSIDQIVLATLHTNQAIEAGMAVAGCWKVLVAVRSP